MPFDWMEVDRKIEERKAMGIFDPELKISEDAKSFIIMVLDRIEAILKNTIIWRGGNGQ